MFKAGQENLKDGQYLLLGKVARPFGIKGEVRIHPYNPFSETFGHIDSLFLKAKDGAIREYKIENIRPHQNFFLVMLEGVDNRDLAEAIRDQEVLVSKEALAPAGEGEFYWFQLLGLKVRLEQGEEVGVVTEIEQTNPYLEGNDILVVTHECRETLVPFTEKYIKKVDLKSGEIIVARLEELKT
jgi:16S rRNA processing protein RimM